MRRAPVINAGLIDKRTLARLDVIATLAFPDGSIGVSALRSEARRGRLCLWRIAGKDMTTLEEVDRMIDKCRVNPVSPVSGLNPTTTIKPPSGLGMNDGASALASALQLAAALKKSLQPPSRQ